MPWRCRQERWVRSPAAIVEELVAAGECRDAKPDRGGRERLSKASSLNRHELGITGIVA
jgi:hypothetical protein